MIQRTPPMGWNSWNTFGKDIDEKLIMEAADALVDTGLADCGYNYVVIDDCWAEMTRNAEGRLTADPVKFPHGMKAVADYVHSKGLKFGMYSCAGTLTCAGYPASYEHEFDDADTFASWGVDFLKYDYCYHSPIVHGKNLYRRMGLALANCGRDILFSACSWGTDDTAQWIKTTGAHMWRSTGDIFDNWGSIKSLIHKQDVLQPLNGQGCFNDMDMLVVGMGGVGNVGKADEVCTDEEYRTHFTAWALLNSPLMIGCDIRAMSPETKATLTNREVLAVNQDPACRQPYELKGIWEGPDSRIYVKALDGGDLAIGMFNLDDHDQNFRINLDMVGLNRCCGRNLALKELWTGEETAFVNESFSTLIPAHGCKLFRAKVVPV